MLLNPSGERNRMVDSGAMRPLGWGPDTVGGSGPAAFLPEAGSPGAGA
jgi:hypothetical protein